jgi:hypothetical protein
VVTLTDAERSAVQSWWSTSLAALERNETPPGAGKFLIKSASEDPGLPVDVVLTTVERECCRHPARGAAPRCEERPSGGNLALGRVTFCARRAGMRGRAIVVAR